MCPVPMPGPDNAVEDMRMPKKTVLQHPKTCVGKWILPTGAGEGGWGRYCFLKATLS